MNESDVPAFAAYIVCIAGVGIYAQRRLATPRSNRSTTRAHLYRQAQIGYVTSIFFFFVVLSFALQYVPFEDLLRKLGTPDIASLKDLPAPLIATVLLTILLPKVPLVRDVDGWLLDKFKIWANIPYELTSRALRLTPEIFRLTPEDVPVLQSLIVDEGLPGTLADFLVTSRGHGLQLSCYRLTRVMKLFQEVRKLTGDPGSQKMFYDYSKEWAETQDTFLDYCERAADGLQKARKLSADVLPEEYEKAMAATRESFGETSAHLFAKLALFVAGSVLATEQTEQDIGSRFRTIGFDIPDEPETQYFPMSELTGLALTLLIYLMAVQGTLQRLHFFDNPPPGRLPVAFSLLPLFIVFCHTVAIGMTVWVIQSHPNLQRRLGGRLRWDIYLCCGLTGAAMVGASVLALFLLRYQELPQGVDEWNMQLGFCALVGSLCFAVACCCDIADEHWPAALPRRLTEGLCCMAFMALVLALIPGPGQPSGGQAAWRGLIPMLIPLSVAFIIGFFVPCLCRVQRVIASRDPAEARLPVAAMAQPR
jgi:hypothetical protein